MTNESRIVRYTSEEIDEMLARGEDETDWAKVDAMTEERLKEIIDADPDEHWDEIGPDTKLYTYGVGLPRAVTLEIDRNVLDWFEKNSDDANGAIETVLRDHVEAATRAERQRKTEAAE